MPRKMAKAPSKNHNTTWPTGPRKRLGEPVQKTKLSFETVKAMGILQLMQLAAPIKDLNEYRIIQIGVDQFEVMNKIAWQEIEDFVKNDPTEATRGLHHFVTSNRLPFKKVVVELDKPWKFSDGIALRGFYAGQSSEKSLAIQPVYEIGEKRITVGGKRGSLLFWESEEVGWDDDLVDPESFQVDDLNALEVCALPIAVVRLLEAANVDLAEAGEQYPRGRIGLHPPTPKFKISIKQNGKRYKTPSQTGSPFKTNYSHRFERRGNYAHHYELTPKGTPNRIFAKWSIERPEKVVMHDGHPCVKIWRPPTVVGPSDKPFVPKVRVIK